MAKFKLNWIDWCVIALVFGLIVLALIYPQAETHSIKKSREEIVQLKKQLAEATKSLEVERISKEQALHELQVARQNQKTDVIEKYRPDGSLESRQTKVKTVIKWKTKREVITQEASESIRYIEVTKVATVSVDRIVKEIVEIKPPAETRTGFSVGILAAPANAGVLAGWSPLKLGPFTADLLGGMAKDSSVILGVGASAEVLPRCSVGAAALTDLSLSIHPALTIQHRF